MSQRPTSQRPSSQRPSGQRYSSQRPSGQRPASGQRHSSGQRPAAQRPSGQRPPVRGRHKKSNPILPILIIILVAAIGGLGFAIYSITRPKTPKLKAVPVAATTDTSVEFVQTQADTTDDTASFGDGPLAGLLDDSADDDPENTDNLPTDVHVTVSDLSVNTSLPTDVKNILLLGADDRRRAGDNIRTDAVMICSINTRTGDVKLTSVLRDLAVDFNLNAEHTLYRINSAYTFGGPELAMRTINQCFNLNIEEYVYVDFFGFQEIAYRLGGIDIDITEAEMSAINTNVIEQARVARKAGIDDSDMPFEELKTYGAQTHLDGRQALAYARIRKLDSDISRAERQRTVLNALAKKLNGKDIGELVGLGATMMSYVKTNMKLEEIASITTNVLSNGLNIKQTYVPITGTYNMDPRNGQAMLYDCDFTENSAYLYKFIYGQ